VSGAAYGIFPIAWIVFVAGVLAFASRAAGRIGDYRLPRDYELLERSFLDWCCDLDADAAAFDLLLWECQRGLIQAP